MSDAISKRKDLQKAFDALDLWMQHEKWIPCSERLPRDDEEVIVTCLDDSGDTPFSYTTTGWHFKGMWVCNDERCMFVIAWMPLPEPYKGGQE